MKSVYIDRLGRLASLNLQRRYVVHATKDTYMLPEELLEDASDLAEALLADLERDSVVSGEQRTALEALARILRVEAPMVPLDGSISNEELIERHPSWSAIRDAAVRCLDVFRIDLPAWERQQEQEVR
jgi:hypothetical protein